MKVLISILILLVLFIGAMKLYDYWERVEKDKDLSDKVAQGNNIDPNQLPGMPWQLDPQYREAVQKGAPGLKQFLETYKKAPKFVDPRLGWIELDYVVMISGADPVEARNVFRTVKERVSTNSVIFPRIRSMEKNYQ